MKADTAYSWPLPPVKKFVSSRYLESQSRNSPSYLAVFLIKKKMETASDGSLAAKRRAHVLGNG